MEESKQSKYTNNEVHPKESVEIGTITCKIGLCEHRIDDQCEGDTNCSEESRYNNRWMNTFTSINKGKWFTDCLQIYTEQS